MESLDFQKFPSLVTRGDSLPSPYVVCIIGHYLSTQSLICCQCIVNQPDTIHNQTKSDLAKSSECDFSFTEQKSLSLEILKHQYISQLSTVTLSGILRRFRHHV